MLTFKSLAINDVDTSLNLLTGVLTFKLLRINDVDNVDTFPRIHAFVCLGSAEQGSAMRHPHSCLFFCHKELLSSHANIRVSVREMR